MEGVDNEKRQSIAGYDVDENKGWLNILCGFTVDPIVSAVAGVQWVNVVLGVQWTTVCGQIVVQMEHQICL